MLLYLRGGQDYSFSDAEQLMWEHEENDDVWDMVSLPLVIKQFNKNFVVTCYHYNVSFKPQKKP